MDEPQMVLVQREIAPGVVMRALIEFSDDWSAEDIAVTQSRTLEFMGMEGRSLTARFKGEMPTRRLSGCSGRVVE